MGSGLVGAGASLLHGLQGLGGVEDWGSVDLGDMRCSKKGQGDIGRGDGFWEFSDGKDIVGIEGEERGVECAT